MTDMLGVFALLHFFAALVLVFIDRKWEARFSWIAALGFLALSIWLDFYFGFR